MESDINLIECENVTAIEDVILTPRFIILTILLGALNVVVLLGNTLVIMSVFTSQKLRTVTNYYIVSLAVADLMLGFSVLPFSTSVELLHYWVFGSTWCSIWLAIDVWLCTASILNLCAISLDRYIAITRPIQYPNLMSPKRGKLIVTAVWVISFVICFPPLIGWDEQSTPKVDETPAIINVTESQIINYEGNLNITELIAMNLTQLDYIINSWSYGNNSCDMLYPPCELTPTTEYRIYASMGSFYIPMLIMVFFYCKIYMAAMKTATSLRKGILTTKASKDANKSSEMALTLRVHRGGCHSRQSSADMIICKNENTNGKACQHPTSYRTQRKAATENSAEDSSKKLRGKLQKGFVRSFKKIDTGKQSARAMYDGYSNSSHSGLKPPHLDLPANHNDRRASVDSFDGEENSSPDSKMVRRKSSMTLRIKRTNVKTYLRKFNRETKATKTLAIIVGAFIVCWLPFFTIYLVGAFCTNCISETVFAVFFWLGYCNSALNPCIYALFSRDFRFAFKRLLSCRRRIRCREEDSVLSTHARHMHVAVKESESLSES